MDPATTVDPAAGTTTAATTTATTTDWRASLPTELQAEKSLAQHKDIGSLAKSYVEAQRMIGGSIRLPKDESPPEEKAKFFRDTMAKFGLPESPDKYTYAKPANMPDGAWSDDAAKGYAAFAHKLGMTNEMVQAHINFQAEMVAKAEAERVEQQNKAYAEAEKQLKARYGTQYEAQIDRYVQAVKTAGDGLAQRLKAAGLDNDPDLVHLLAIAGERLEEGGIIHGTGAGRETQEDAEAKIKALYSDPKTNWSDPKTLAELERLNRIAVGAAGNKVITTFG